MTKELNPYVEHGNKKDKIKKITVSVPIEIYETIQTERKRRVQNKMRHATASEILCEAFAHAFTGQPLPQDEELLRYMSKAKMQTYQEIEKKNKENAISNAISVAETFVTNNEFTNIINKIIEDSDSNNLASLQISRLFHLLTTFVLSETLSNYALALKAQKLFANPDQNSSYEDFIKFIELNSKNMNRISHICSELLKTVQN